MQNKSALAICLTILVISLCATTGVAQLVEKEYSDHYRYYYNDEDQKLKVIHHDNFYNSWDTTLFFYQDDRLVCEKLFDSKTIDSINYIYDKTGKLLSEHHSDKKINVLLEYDLKGKLAYKFEKQDGSLIQDTVETNIYDSKERLISEKTILNTKSGIKVFQWNQYTYNDQSQIYLVKRLRQDGSLIETQRKFYGPNGKQIKKLVFNEKNELTDSMHFSYNSNDSLTEINCYEDTILTRKEQWKYEDKRIITYIGSYYNAFDGELSSVFTVKEYYDARKRLIKKTYYDQMYIEIEIME